jgi:DNA polymerase V
MVTVFIQTDFLGGENSQYSRSITITTDFPTNSTIELNKAAQKGFSTIFKAGYRYKKAGVIVMGLTSNNETQLNLFKTSNPKHQPLMSVIDKMNQCYGENKIKFGVQSLGRQWKMRQDNLSPKFSTCLKDVIIVKV